MTEKNKNKQRSEIWWEVSNKELFRRRRQVPEKQITYFWVILLTEDIIVANIHMILRPNIYIK